MMATWKRVAILICQQELRTMVKLNFSNLCSLRGFPRRVLV